MNWLWLIGLMVVIGIIIGVTSGGLTGGLKGLLYAFTVSFIGLTLTIIPIAGPLITCFVVIPWLRSLLHVPPAFSIIDLIVIVVTSIINALVTFVIVATVIARR